jgi:hypothetical protein
VDDLTQTQDVRGFSRQGPINVLANLRRAVEHASLPAHEQRLDAILPESKAAQQIHLQAP